MRRIFGDALNTLADIRDMFLDWKFDIDNSDDIQGILRFFKKIFRFLLVRGKVGLRQLWGTGLGLILLLTLVFSVIPMPTFEKAERKESVEQTVESAVEQAVEKNAEITARAKAGRPVERKPDKPVNWNGVIGLVVVAVMANLVCALTFWRKDRKKVTPESVKERLKEADSDCRERKRNIMFELFRSQGLDMREVKNPKQLADDVSDEMEEKDDMDS